MAANLTLANKNPFSTFDFLGYFIPGAFAIGIAYLLSDGLSFHEEIPQSIDNLKKMMNNHEGYVIFMLILSSYVLGHLISYLSSVTVEIFYIWCNGYPTDYLLLDGLEKECILFSKKGGAGNIWHVIVCGIIFPLFVCHFLVEKLLVVGPFLSKRINDDMRDLLIKRINILLNKVGYGKTISKEDKSTLDVHRAVMHYVYENCQQHIVKYDNYVAIYGFLRSITLIFNMAFMYVVFRFFSQYGAYVNCWSIFIAVMLSSIIFVYANSKLRESSFNSVLCAVSGVFVIFFTCSIFSSESKAGEIFQMLVLFLLTYLSYLGYTKFYRRFTLENLMSLLVCKELD